VLAKIGPNWTKLTKIGTLNTNKIMIDLTKLDEN